MSPRKVAIAHDYQCPWAWIALFQVQRLKSQVHGLDFDWVGCELLPDISNAPPVRPVPSTRFMELASSERVAVNLPMPPIVSTHDALAGAEFVKEHYPEAFDAYNEDIYKAMWSDGKDISDQRILSQIVRDIGLDTARFAEALADKRYDATVKPLGAFSYAVGITHVPTFIFNGERCSEASYDCVLEMAQRFSERYLHA